ncbi:hypothetical protein GGQ87_001786 [Brevundimonas alba]|uniref:Tip attachment protein J domain-containing protein n=1 Tax=Brevundimonas alba TaxID=74314 RepID=A0A7X6BMW5_9CAUL|nr:phage tail protein [Brevundimonas alba]NJC41528.1 hypothetical protein [Brevundimonas alba]
MVAAERDGRVAIVGDEPATLELSAEALALPANGGSVRADRTLEAAPSAARVRFIDGSRDYQTGSVVLRTASEGGGLDIDLPAVCSRALALTAAARRLEQGSDRLTLALGPLESLTVEPGDVVTVEADERNWRVGRRDRDETPSALLEPTSGVSMGEDDGIPSPGEPSGLIGEPFFRMIDPPPLAGVEEDRRPIAVVSGDPWRPMRVFAGADSSSLTTRGDVGEPATVGILASALGFGVCNRWDEANVLDVRVEGRAPESLSVHSVLAGGNALAVETASGWEIIQFRAAQLIGDGIWRLSGLLRGQQGTDVEAMEGAETGTIVVFLDQSTVRVASPSSERGLSMVWRAGPVGAPAGGAGVSDTAFTPGGRNDRPWSPAHLRSALRVDGGFDLGWVARNRIDGDRWDGEPAMSDSLRFQVRILDAGDPVRVFEVDAQAAVYSAVDVAADFEGDLAGAEAAVAQWGEGYGWGTEARVRLV